MEWSKKKKKQQGWLFLALWFLLIWAGIYDKEILGHQDLMVFFHLPAAVFLVLATYNLSAGVRARYKESLKRYSGQRPQTYSKTLATARTTKDVL